MWRTCTFIVITSNDRLRGQIPDHTYILKRRHSATPQDQLNVTKTPTLPDAVLPKGEKTSVNWVTCHRRIFALSMISLRDLHRDPGEVLSATGVGTVRWCSVLAVFVLYFVKFSTPRRTSAHSKFRKIHFTLNANVPR